MKRLFGFALGCALMLGGSSAFAGLTYQFRDTATNTVLAVLETNVAPPPAAWDAGVDPGLFSNLQLLPAFFGYPTGDPPPPPTPPTLTLDDSFVDTFSMLSNDGTKIDDGNLFLNDDSVSYASGGSTITFEIFRADASSIFVQWRVTAPIPEDTGTEFRVDGEWRLQAVPEPTSIALVAMGVSGLALRRRRRGSPTIAA